MSSAAERNGTEVTGPGAVSGLRMIHFITDLAVVDRVVDLTTASIGAWTGDPISGFTFYPGSGQVDGTFSIPAVPLDTYYFKFGSDYVSTTARTIDLSSYEQGRPDVGRPDAGTILALDIQGLNPWQQFGDQEDDAQMISSNAGLFFFDAFFQPIDLRELPRPGDTSISQRINYPAYFDPRLVDAASGDETVLYQLVTKPAGAPDAGIFYQAAAKVLTTSKFSIVDGQTSTLSGTFTDIPQDQDWSLFLRFSSFQNYRQTVHPSATFFADMLFVDPLPGGLSHGFYTNSPDLVEMVKFRTVPDQDLSFNYGNPFPQWGPLFVDARAVFRVRYSLPLPDGGTSLPANTSPSLLTQEAQASFPNPFEIQISPPQNVTVNGEPASGDLSGITVTPVIAWDPPAVGLPTDYVVQVWELFMATPTRTARRFAARFFTPGPGINVPPGVLELGRNYYIAVFAYNRPNYRGQDAPYLFSFPTSSAPAQSGILSP